MHAHGHGRGRFPALLMSLAMIISLAACGDNVPVDGGGTGNTADQALFQGEFAGSGASSQQSADEAWIAGFRKQHPGARISYDPAGSGAGVNAFLSGSTIWAGTDAPLTSDQLERSRKVCGSGTAFDLPVYATPIAVAYNLPDLWPKGSDGHLRMDPALIAMIFSGKVTNWRDPRIAALNPGANLPDLDITVIHRSDKSGTTKSFLSYLHDTAGSAWPYPAGENWPNDLGQGAKGTAGVVMTMNQAQGTFGYADAAQTTGLGTVAVQVGKTWQPPTAKTVANLLDAAQRDPQASQPGRVVLTVNHRTTQEHTYPIVLVSYDVVCTAYRDDRDGSKAQFAKAWLTYLLSEQGQRMAAANAGSAELGQGLRAQAMASVETIGGKS